MRYVVNIELRGHEEPYQDGKPGQSEGPVIKDEYKRGARACRKKQAKGPDELRLEGLEMLRTNIHFPG